MGIFSNLTEELKRTIYSGAEARQETGLKRKLSTTTPDPLLHEPDVILTDVQFNHYLGAQAEFIITQRNMLIRQWRQSTFLPEVDEAIQEILNEALVFEEDDSLPIELNMDDFEAPDNIKKSIEEAFAKILRLLDFRNQGSEIFRQWYVDGVVNLEVVYDNASLKSGIQRIKLLTPFDFYKVKDIKTNEITYFYNTKLSADMYKRQDFTLQGLLHDAEDKLIYKPEQVTQITSGVTSVDKLFSISPINKAMKTINQVSLIEDSLLIYRITRSPDKKAFYIDTGRLPKDRAEQYINQMMQKHRNKINYNRETGTIENEKKTISVMEDYWMGRSSEGRGTQIETISGTGQELRDIADLDYFYNKMWRALQVPINRRNKEESRMVGLSSANFDIEREEIKFHKYTVQLRKKFNEIFRDLLKKELISTKVTELKDWKEWKENIRFVYKNNSEYAEMKKLQVFESRMNIAALTTDLLEQHIISKEWIKREVMNQTEEEIAEIQKEIDADKAEEPDEEEGEKKGGFGGGKFGR